MTLSTLPPLRQPPHDPLSLRLGGRLGWPVLPGGDPLAPPLAVADGSIGLPRFPGSLRSLTEPSGSFAGQRLPANAACDDAGAVWLLPPHRPALMRFDPCACGFEEVPCFGGRGAGAGQLADRTGGIAITAGHLLVCDPGNQRVQVVLLPRAVVSGVWRAPDPWQPEDVVVDHRFRVHVVDPLGGLVHHFGWSGRYLGNTPGVGASRFLALAGDGSLVASGDLVAYRVADGVATPLPTTVEDGGSPVVVPAPPVTVAADGAMHLGALCVAPRDTWIGTDGTPVPAPLPPAQLHETSAVGVIGPLDSLIDDCVWDRLTLVGQVPDGCSVSIDSLGAQVPLSPAEVVAMPPSAWDTGLTCSAMPDGAWDVLLRGRPARHLWLRVGLRGNGLRTPRLDEAVVEFPRISLRRYLPAVYGAEPTSADFTDRLLAIVDRTLRQTEDAIDDLPAILDPRATPYLDWLASWIGMRPDHRLPESLQRDIVANAGHLLDQRGTPTGLRRLLLVALGLDREPSCTRVGGHCEPCPPPRVGCPPQPRPRTPWEPPPLVLEHFRLRRWFEAGASRLGDQTVLWGQSIVGRSQLGANAQVGVTALKGSQDPLRDPFHVHAHKFTVFVPAAAGRTPERRKAVERLVAWGSPAHTVADIAYVDARLRIGVQSSIGLDTVVARMPQGFTLGQTALGPASVLDGDDRPIIDTTAVGTTAVLG
jgi:phage tail-like protein